MRKYIQRKPATPGGFSALQVVVNFVADLFAGFFNVLRNGFTNRLRSLALACFEHALYGCVAFTLGLGRYLYTGAAWG